MSTTWSRLLSERRVAAEAPDKRELDQLRQLAARNLNDAAAVGLSAEGKFEFAYNAGRVLATVVIRASGYRITARAGAHYYTFLALEVAGPAFAAQAILFDTARDKRNELSYDDPDVVTDTEASDILDQAHSFQREVDAWLRRNHPRLA